MGRFLPILFLLSIPWGIRTWWRMRCAGGPKERAFIQRSSMAGWMFVALAVLALFTLPVQAKLLALPFFCVTGLGLKHGWKRNLARIRAEESDPFNRAKRIN